MRNVPELREYEMVPFRPDRRSRERRQEKRDLDRTQFRALGWSLKCRRSVDKLADQAFGAFLVLLMGCLGLGVVLSPVLIVVCLWRMLA